MPDGGKFLYLDPLSNPSVHSHPVSSGSPDPGLGMTDEEILDELIRILSEDGTDIMPRLSGYLITEDPSYLPEETDARPLARRIGRDRLLELLIHDYIGHHGRPDT